VALAGYFDKLALSAQSILANFDLPGFRRTLESQVLQVRFGPDAMTSEGRRTLELLTDLVSRLFPRLQLLGASEAAGIVPALADRARQINRLITIEQSAPPTLTIVVGQDVSETADRTFFTGSDGWVCHASTEAAMSCGNSANPFGASMSACLAAAWTFRETFAAQLSTKSGMRGTVAVSVLDLSRGEGATNPRWKPVDIGVSHLVGVGAIGNATIWALSGCAGLAGTLYLIDGERLELSNLQRYVCTAETDVGLAKPDLAARMLSRFRDLRTIPVRQRWESFVAEHEEPIDRVLLALDSAESRIRVQSSLPRWIANGWTQPENIGVSRHRSFLDEPCVACLYMPAGQLKNLDQLVAEAIGFTSESELREVRLLLHTGRPVGRALLERICEKNAAPLEAVLGFANEPLASFYARGVCGGLLLQFLANGRAVPAQVPMAFQSAAAGLLLASELVADAGDLRQRQLPARSELNLLREISMSSRPHSPAVKHSSGRCICQDDVFRSVYMSKWGPQGTVPGSIDGRSTTLSVVL